MQIGWYNEKVLPGFKLDYPDDTLAFIVISTPSFFDNSFVPFVQTNDLQGTGDFLDKCVAHHFETAAKVLKFVSHSTVRFVNIYIRSFQRIPSTWCTTIK